MPIVKDYRQRVVARLRSVKRGRTFFSSDTRCRRATEDTMTTTPRLVKSLTQVNTADAAFALGGLPVQADGQIARLPDGGYVVVWMYSSRRPTPTSQALVGPRYDSPD